ncbi:MAG: TAXI family TRAP transporter solute-binding subunit [Alphaproteobacteria bacterium]
MKKSILSTVFAAAIAFTTSAVAENSVTIGTGGQTGVYYQVGQAVCKLVNAADVDINCVAPSTGGSIANINALKSGDQQFGVAQSDWQYHAVHGTSRFEDQGADDKLRFVFSLHPEPFNVVARADSGIKTFSDLKGKRVNIGPQSSGFRGTMEEIMKGLGWTTRDFKLAAELKPAEAPQALCDNNIDAFVYSVGHPAAALSEAATTCDVVMVPLTDKETKPVIDKLIADNDFYSPAVIPGGMYKGNPDDVETFGVGATLLSYADVPDDVVYNVVKTIFENFNRFKRLHPAFEILKEEDMVNNLRSAPYHPGAEKYYKEMGWLK